MLPCFFHCLWLSSSHNTYQVARLSTLYRLVCAVFFCLLAARDSLSSTMYHQLACTLSFASYIYFDLSKTIRRKVSHKLPLLKLSKLHIDPNMLCWIQLFCTYHSQFVHANGTNSSLSLRNLVIRRALSQVPHYAFLSILTNCYTCSISLIRNYLPW